MSKSISNHESAQQHVESIHRATRKQYSTEEKIRIVLEGLRGEYSIAELRGARLDWHTDFTYLEVTGWGWFYLSIILDDYSRYVIAWRLCTTMKAEDVTETLEQALNAPGLDCATVRPRLLPDNGSSYIETELSEWMEAHQMKHVHGAPYHPMTQGKIE